MRLFLFFYLILSGMRPALGAVTAPALQFTVEVDSIHHIDCLSPKGYLSLRASGGTAPYTYQWSNGNSTFFDDDLEAGAVEIFVYDSDGNVANLFVEIHEDRVPPFANAGADFNLLCSTSTATLSGSGSAGMEFRYAWTGFSGGVIQSGANTLTPVIRHTGGFSLRVTNINNGCFSTDTVSVSSTHQAPSITATGGTFNCIQTTVTLSSTYPQQNIVWWWTGPNGFLSYDPNPEVSVTGVFVFRATDTITTCVNTANALVYADTMKPVFVPVGGTITCSQPSVTIQGVATPANCTFFWKGPPNFTSTLQNPAVFNGGTFKVTVTNPSNGCARNTVADIDEDLLPPGASAAVSGELTCINSSVQLSGSSNTGSVNYLWTGPNGFNSNLQNPVVTIAGNYQLRVTNPVNGCTSVATVAVVSNTVPPGASATGAVRTCAIPNPVITANSPTQGVTYHWIGPGLNSFQQNPAVSNNGTYFVTVTNPANGCTSAASAVVTQNTTQPSLTTTTATINCYNPSPQITAASQTQGATFSWTGPNGFTSGVYNPNVSVSGFYYVTVTNPVNGCTNSASVWVPENFDAPIVFAGTDRVINCLFPTILANPVGTSTGNFLTYSWTTWNGEILYGQNTLYARFGAPGSYTLKVTNTITGCFRLDSMTVSENPPVEIQASVLTQILCNGGATGVARVTAQGGSGTFFYNWSSGSTTATASGLAAGIHAVTVTDTDGCSATTSVSLTQPAALILTATSTGQTMSGVNNGTATVSISGGNFPYSILWNTGSNLLTINNLAPGQYSVTVTDANGCSKIATATVNSLQCSIAGVITPVHPTCSNSNNGSASVSVSGVPNPVSYSWSNGLQSQGISNLAAGTYTVTATGGNGCTISLSTQLTAPQPIASAEISNQSVSCFGSQNGSATLEASGGTGPFTYNWSNSSSGAMIAGVPAGVYTCTISDSKGCSATRTVTIGSPAALSVALTEIIHPDCQDSQNGSFLAGVNGGATPFNYSWSNGSSAPAQTGLGVGTYTCTVTDANGCTGVTTGMLAASDNTPPQLLLKNAGVELDSNGMATVNYTLFDNGSSDQSCGIAGWTVSPQSFDCSLIGSHVITLTATDRNGNVATGTATLVVADRIAPGLTCPSNQTIMGCASQAFFDSPQVTDNCIQQGAPIQTAGLPSGASFPQGVTIQQFSYTDAGGNVAACQFTITATEGVSVQIQASPATCTATCNGSAVISPLSGNIGSVVWSNGQTGLTATDLCAGQYQLTVTASAGCSQVFNTSIQVLDTEIPALVCPPDVTTGVCNPIATFGIPQVTDNCPFNPAGLQLIEGLPSGSVFPLGTITETYRYTDGGGNTAQCSFKVTVQPVAGINFSFVNATCHDACDGVAIIETGGASFSVIWNNGATGTTATGLCPGMYEAEITDPNGCEQTQTVVISSPLPLEISSFLLTHDMGNMGTGSIQVSVAGGTAPYSYSWKLNGQPFSSEKDIFNLYAGDYILEVEDVNNCSMTSQAFAVNSSVGISTPEDDKTGLVIFPNPVSSSLTLRMEDPAEDISTVTVTDITGRLLYHQMPSAEHIHQLDVSGFPSGVLLVRVRTQRGWAGARVVKD
ncbi:MAG: hypothetical protein RJA20_2415 [Bacteroidota bacterium]